MKIFITGVTGFIGSQLAPELKHRGHEVYGLVRYNTTRTQKDLPYQIVNGDLIDYVCLRRIIGQINPDVIIHLAAVSPVGYSYDHPIEVSMANYIGTVNLAEIARTISELKHFIYASTSETYGIQDKVPISESAPLRPNTPYAISKAAAEEYIKLYLGPAQGFPFSIAKPFNTYGRRDTNRFVVESLMTQMLKKPSEIVAGDPDPIRDFLYVDDHVNAYLTLVEKGAQRDVFNFCTGRGISIKQMGDILREITGFTGKIKWNAAFNRPVESGTLLGIIGNESKAENKLGWKPRYTLEDGLKRTAEYWKMKLDQDKE